MLAVVLLFCERFPQQLSLYNILFCGRLIAVVQPAKRLVVRKLRVVALQFVRIFLICGVAGGHRS